MDTKLKAWIIEQHDRFPTDKKEIFLRLLKIDPEKVLEIISKNLMDWATVYSAQTGKTSFAYNHNEICKEVLQALQEHFATDLAAIVAVEKCVSCPEDSTAQITAHCKVCKAALCAGHIFECRTCNEPMCHPCWTKYGKDFCPDCSGQVSGSFRLQG